MNNSLSKKELYDQQKNAKELSQLKRQQNKKTKSFILWILVVGIIFLSVFAIVKLSTKDTPTGRQGVGPEISSQDHLQGSLDAPLVLIEYSDFQCPACKSYDPIIKEVLKKYKDTLVFAYRHFPLKSIHPNAEPAALASEAAAKQNAFWQMHDLLFDRQDQWADSINPTKKFLGYAKDLKLDLEQFKMDYRSDEIAKKVDDDYSGGVNLAINSTPTFFLGGVKIKNFRNATELSAILDGVLTLIQAEKNIKTVETNATPETTPINP